MKNYHECTTEELEERIKKAGYKLNGQVTTLENRMKYIQDVYLRCQMIENLLFNRISRIESKELNDLLNDIHNKKNYMDYAYNTAIDQNLNIRSILEKGVEVD